ncbi:SDR family oxidoreductase [Herbaspirillum sp.]|uniref:SDR family oxidoreductase n=1 Tax=Herbaspirillum sp. TaxID=1890675 RepID=UPI0031D2E85F
MANEHDDLILLTGATGFLGGAVAVELMRQRQGDRLLLMVRGADAADAHARVTSQLRRLGAPEESLRRLRPAQILLASLERVESIAGDTRLARVGVAIHCAAHASFTAHPAMGALNVDASVILAHLLQRYAPLRRFVYIGTAMACGNRQPAGSDIPESAALPLDERAHLVPYTHSKAVCELLLRKMAPALPLVVLRPSIVVGHTRLGCAPSASIYWVFRAWRALGASVAELRQKIDVVPVDWCAAAVAAAALRPEWKHGLLHLSAGAQRSCSFADIDAELARAAGESPGAYGILPPERLPELLPRIRERLPDCNPRLMLRALRLYGGFARLGYTFDNRAMQEAGIPPPPPLTRYIGLCAQSVAHQPVSQQMAWDFK